MTKEEALQELLGLPTPSDISIKPPRMVYHGLRKEVEADVFKAQLALVWLQHRLLADKN